MTILLFIIILAVLVLSHELGHFIMAKRAGVRVDEFGFGFPPRLWSFKRGETIYSINLIPFGGFVKIYGEDNESLKEIENPDIKRSFVGQSKITQTSIIAAGIVFNVILAWVLFSAGYMIGFPTSVDPSVPNQNVKDISLKIVGLELGSPAKSAGLLPGDVIKSLQADTESLASPTPDTVREFISKNGTSKINIEVIRNNISQNIDVVPEKGLIASDKERYAIGIGMDLVGTEVLPIHKAIYKGFFVTIEALEATAKGFFDLIYGIFTGTTKWSSVSGPVGIAGLVGDAASLGLVYILTLSAIISINLAVINVIPFPALDGGRLLFILIETIKRKPISARTAGAFNLTGFVLLMILMIVITYGDIAKIVVGR